MVNVQLLSWEKTKLWRERQIKFLKVKNLGTISLYLQTFWYNQKSLAASFWSSSRKPAPRWLPGKLLHEGNAGCYVHKHLKKKAGKKSSNNDVSDRGHAFSRVGEMQSVRCVGVKQWTRWRRLVITNDSHSCFKKNG